MKVLNYEHVIYFDVDNTLIIHDKKNFTLELEDPYFPGHTLKVRPHKHNIRVLKTSVIRKYNVFVWSHAGIRWAESVIRQLKLEKLVTAVVPKIQLYSDDMKIDDWGLRNCFQVDG